MDELLLYFGAVSRRFHGFKIVDQSSDLGGRYWDRTSDLFGVNADSLCVCLLMSVVVCR